jgi:hypothetical protein
MNKNINLLVVLLSFFITIGINAQAIEEKLDFTLLIYMNGSDLESKHMLATKDIQEMVSSFNPSCTNFKISVLHGGTNKWHLDTKIATDSITYSQITNSGFKKIKSIKNQSIGNSNTLIDFIKYSVKNYPAKKYGIVFWNHGRGSVHGFGYDEIFENDRSLTLLELQNTFNSIAKATILPNNKFEFIGFDACLMGTYEVARSISDYSNYLLASQELEPGEGWDYKFIIDQLSTNNTKVDKEFLTNVIKSYIKSYSEKENILATLSLIDLNTIGRLDSIISKLTLAIDNNLINDKHAFKQKASYRVKSKSFGNPSFQYTAEDMIDLYSFFKEATKSTDSILLNQLKLNLDSIVIYNGVSENLKKETISGLSIYHPYYNKKLAKNLNDYFVINNNEDYKNYLLKFIDELTGLDVQKPITDSDRNLSSDFILNLDKIYLTIRKDDISYGFDTNGVTLNNAGTIVLNYPSDPMLSDQKWNKKWFSLNDVNLPTYLIEKNSKSIIYACPIRLNNNLSELIIRYNLTSDPKQGPYKAQIVGVRENSQNEVSSRIIEIKEGDEIEILGEDTTKQDLTYISLHKFIIYDPKNLIFKKKEMPSGKYEVGFCMIDIYGTKHFTKFEDFIIE